MTPDTVPFTLQGIADPFRKSTAGSGVFVAIDYETATRATDSACSVGVVRVEKGELVARETLLIRPPRQEFIFSELHGIDWNKVANERVFADVWQVIMPLFDGAEFLCAHNAPFDRGVTLGCCKAYSLVPPPHPWKCTLEMSRKRWRGQPCKLSDVCQRLGITLNHHEAGSDAEACARVMLALS